MKVEYILLYSTPLDIEHSKVIDIIGDVPQDQIMSTYALTLEENYVHELIEDFTIKSIKIIDKQAELVLSKNYFDLLKYNYCEINGKYFFIESVTSLNDSDTNPSCRLLLRWDYWANNLQHFNNKSITQISTRHIDRFINGDINIPKFYPNNINELAHIEKEIILEKYSPLFLKVKLNPSAIDEYRKFRIPFTLNLRYNQIIYQSTDYSYILYGDKTAFTDIVYIPLGVLDNETKLFINSNVTSSYVAESNTNRFFRAPSTKLPFTQENHSIELNNKNTEYIISAELTFNIPHTYSIEENGDEVNLIFESPILFYDGQILGEDENYGITNKFGLPILSVIPLQSTFTIDGEEEIINLSIDEFVTNNYRLINIDYKGLLDIPQINLNIKTNDNMNDHKMSQFPFKYLKINYNQNNIIITPKSLIFNGVKLKINTITDQPSLNIIYNENNIDDNSNYISPKETFIDNNGTISYTEDFLTSYNIRNGARTAINSLASILSDTSSAFINYVSKNFIQSAKDIASGIFTGAKLSALYYDLSKTPDTVKPSSLSEFDLISQDRIRLFLCYVDYNSNTFKSNKENLYAYGYDINELGNPFENTRVWFDYVQTNNCKLSLNINNEDKKELEDMFNRGVHKFHIIYENENELKSSLSLDPTGYNNIEYSLWKGEL